MKDKYKYVILIGSVIAFGLLCVLLIFKLDAEQEYLERLQVEEQVGPTATEDSDSLPSNEIGLYSGNMTFVKENFLPYWEDLRNQIEDYCIEHNIDSATLDCRDKELQYTNEYNPYIIVHYPKGRLLFLFDTHVEPVTLDISELPEYPENKN